MTGARINLGHAFLRGPSQSNWKQRMTEEGVRGKVRVNPPPNDITPKDPFFLLSLLGSLVSSIKGIAEVQSDLPLVSAKGRDAVISLERNAKGEVIIGKIAFVRP